MLKPTEVRAVSAEFLDYSGVIGVFEADFEIEEVAKPEFVELARLFQAAPELYEALREIVLGVKQGTTWGIEKAEQALAKAEPRP
jgi:hypothetical protein